MNYHNIVHESMTNGDGIRTVLFVSGCTHGCPGCQNPETWDKNSGIPFDEAAHDELMDSLKDPFVSGVTFSGGDPMAPFNRYEVMDLIREINDKYPEKTIWVYTGFTKEQLIEQDPWLATELLNRIDVMVDGPFEIDKLDVDYEWAGSTNQRVLRKENNFEANTANHFDYEKEMYIDENTSGQVNESCSCSRDFDIAFDMDR